MDSMTYRVCLVVPKNANMQLVEKYVDQEVELASKKEDVVLKDFAEAPDPKNQEKDVHLEEFEENVMDKVLVFLLPVALFLVALFDSLGLVVENISRNF